MYYLHKSRAPTDSISLIFLVLFNKTLASSFSLKAAGNFLPFTLDIISNTLSASSNFPFINNHLGDSGMIKIYKKYDMNGTDVYKQSLTQSRTT